MDKFSDFERRLTAGLETYAGPQRAIDPVAITRAASTRTAPRPSVFTRVTRLFRASTPIPSGRSIRALPLGLAAIATVATLVVGVVAVGSLLRGDKSPSLVLPTASSSTSPSVASPSLQPTASAATTSSPVSVPFVLYVRRGPAKYAATVWVARADGSAARELSSTASDVAWSQDGRRLLIVPLQESQRLLVADVGDVVGPLVDTGMDTGSATGCTGQGGTPWPCQDGWFSFAPDGRHIAFARRCTWELPGCYSIATMDLGSGHVTTLGATTESGSRPIEGVKWSPDGSKIAFSRVRDMGVLSRGGQPFSDIFTIDADGQNLRRLDLGDLSASAPAWSADGSTIAFATDIWRTEFKHETDVYTIHADGTGLRRLTTDHVSSEPAWTSDGRLRFWRSGHPWIMDLDGANATQLPDLGIGTDRLFQTGWPTSGVVVQPAH